MVLFSQISYFAAITAHDAELLTPRAFLHHIEQLDTFPAAEVASLQIMSHPAGEAPVPTTLPGMGTHREEPGLASSTNGSKHSRDHMEQEPALEPVALSYR